MRDPAMRPAPFVVLRAPLQPFDDFLRWSEGVEAAAAPDDPEALARDRKRLRERLAAWLERPEVREALFVASPDLSASIEAWEADPESDRGRDVERGLVRYFTRASTRPTPFGMFAGCSLGATGDSARLRLSSPAEVRRHARLDAHYLAGLARALAADPAIRGEVRFVANPTRLEVAGRFRYVESRQDGEIRTYHLSAVEATEEVRIALARAEEGALLREVGESLRERGLKEADAASFVDDLVEVQLLVPELEVPVTGPQPLEGLIEQLRGLPAAAPAASLLTEVGRELSAMNAGPPGLAPEVYRGVAARLDALPGDVDRSLLYQVDMTRPAEVTLPPPVLAELERGIGILRRLAPAEVPDDLRAFREAFLERYQGREVPLLEALDDEVGIGFGPGGGPAGSGSPLLRGLEFPARTDETARWGPVQRLVLRRVQEAIAAGATEAHLTKADLASLPEPAALPLPDALAVTATIAARSEDALDHGAFRVVLQGAFGPSGARLLGRFAHADPELHRRIDEHLRTEEALDPGAVFAEVVHLSQGRLANILARPVLRAHEIEYLGRSGAPPERRIAASDLMVSVRGPEIVLRSRRLGRRVAPRLTSAHNFGRRTLPVYRFLCRLQAQGVREMLLFDLGPLADAPFVPRIVSGPTVLSLARWRVPGDEIRGLTAAGDRFARVDAWRARRGLPRLVAVTDGDNRLVVDLENALSVDSFVSLIARGGDALLTEVYPGPEELCLRGPEGAYAHEIVVPFVRAGSPRSVAPLVDRVGEGARIFPPGSEWLYARLPTAESLADRVLLETVAPLAERLLADGAIDRWFFIRYSDPSFHLRLRFHGDPGVLRTRVLPELLASIEPLLEDGAVRAPTLETYDREVERYGGPRGIELCERIFHADAETVVEILSMLEPADAGADERWRMGLAGAAALAADLGMDLEARRRLFAGLAGSMAEEFRATTALKRGIGERFRAERAALEPLVTGELPADHPLLPGLDVLRTRSERLAPIVGELLAEPLWVELPALASSLIHMHLNRLLRAEPRAHELVLYDFLSRIHRALLERSDEPGPGA